MANLRRKYTQAEEVALTTSVGSACPKCGTSLFYRKRSGFHKDYELAHIYPLNPTATELVELAGVSLLHADVNDPDNVIPLCTRCHTRFDKPRTRSDYEELASLKRGLIRRAIAKDIQAQFPLDGTIRTLVSRLHAIDTSTLDAGVLVLDSKSIKSKFDSTLPLPTRNKIRRAVADYYTFVQHEFQELERADPNSSQLIFAQVRGFYLKQRTLGFSQLNIYGDVVDWIYTKTQSDTLEAAEILAAFFVQNCEVFE